MFIVELVLVQVRANWVLFRWYAVALFAHSTNHRQHPMSKMRWFLVYTRNHTEYLPRNYSIDMQFTIEQVDKDYIESTKSLRPLQKYGSTVNRRLVEIYTKYTGEQVEQKSCCSSERSIFYTEFLKWYESTI